MPLHQYLCMCLHLWIVLTRYSYSMKTGCPQSTIWGTEYLPETVFAGRTGGTLWIKVLLQSCPFCQQFLSVSPFHALWSNQLVLKSCVLTASFWVWSNQSIPTLMSPHLLFGNVSAVKNIRLAGNPICLFSAEPQHFL